MNLITFCNHDVFFTYMVRHKSIISCKFIISIISDLLESSMLHQIQKNMTCWNIIPYPYVITIIIVKTCTIVQRTTWLYLCNCKELEKPTTGITTLLIMKKGKGSVMGRVLHVWPINPVKNIGPP